MPRAVAHEALTDVDPLLIEAVKFGAGVSAEDRMHLGHSDYAVLDSAVAALSIGQNRMVRTVHTEVAGRLKQYMQLELGPVPRRDRGEGYVPLPNRKTDPWAIKRHVKYIGHTVTDLVAASQALRPIHEGPSIVRRCLTGQSAINPSRGRLMLQKRAAKQVDPIDASQPRLLPVRLYERAFYTAQAIPRTDESDRLAVGLLGAYRTSWEQSGADEEMLPILPELNRATNEAANQVYGQLLGENTRAMEPRDLHAWIGELSLGALGVEMGAVLGRPLRVETGGRSLSSVGLASAAFLGAHNGNL